jgi:hypothetical protein
MPQGMRLDPYVEGPLPSCAQLTARDPADGVVVRGRSATGTWQGAHWMYQSAKHTLYAGTTHRRAVLLVGRDIFVVVDLLDSDAPRTYTQNWHLAPRIPMPSDIRGDSGSFHVTFARGADDSAPLMSLHQASEGAALNVRYGEPMIGGVFGQGWYSIRENEAEPNAVVEVRREGVTITAFASVFLLGKRAGQHAEVTLQRNGATSATVTIQLDDGKTLALDIQQLANDGENVVVR